jgi:hypothetical protein
MTTEISGFVCPFCSSRVSWKISGTGKHYTACCGDHGFVRIVRNPIWPKRQPERMYINYTGLVVVIILLLVLLLLLKEARA